MAGTGSFTRGDKPRSVPDPLAEPYAAMTAKQRAYNTRQEAGKGLTVEHPGTLESMAPIWGSGKEAVADWQEKKYVRAGVNAALAASDIFLAKAVVSGVLKGGLKTAGPYVWRTKYKEKLPNGDLAVGAREWLGKQGFLKPGQPGHHWLIPQKSWVPEVIKNQPPFVMGTKDAVQHGRIHGPYTVNGVRLPRFSVPERLWFGTPPWAKAAAASVTGHAGEAVDRAVATSPPAPKLSR